MAEQVSIPVALLHDERLSLNDVRVYAALIEMAGNGAECSPTRAELQRVSGVQRISRHTKKLSECGHIQVAKSGEGNRNIYKLTAKLQTQEQREVTLSTFGKEFREYSLGFHTEKTRETYLTALREFIRIVGDLPLRSVGVREIERFLGTKKAEASVWTARKYYIALRSIFQKAVQWNYIPENPFSKVSKPKTPELMPAYFTENDFRLFMSVVEDRDFRDLCSTAITTGMRLGELLALRWEDVDFGAKVIRVRNSETFITKTKKNRVIPIDKELYPLLEQRKENMRVESSLVFHAPGGGPLKPGTVSAKFKRYVRAACLNDKLHFHSLRHSFASKLVSASRSLYEVQTFLGHTTSEVTQIYAHLRPEELHEAIKPVGEFIACLRDEKS
jgi:integrase